MRWCLVSKRKNIDNFTQFFLFLHLLNWSVAGMEWGKKNDGNICFDIRTRHMKTLIIYWILIVNPFKILEWRIQYHKKAMEIVTMCRVWANNTLTSVRMATTDWLKERVREDGQCAVHILYSFCPSGTECLSEYETESIILSTTINKRWHKLNGNILFHPFASPPIYRNFIWFDMVFCDVKSIRWIDAVTIIIIGIGIGLVAQCFHFYHHFFFPWRST